VPGPATHDGVGLGIWPSMKWLMQPRDRPCNGTRRRFEARPREAGSSAASIGPGRAPSTGYRGARGHSRVVHADALPPLRSAILLDGPRSRPRRVLLYTRPQTDPDWRARPGFPCPSFPLGPQSAVGRRSGPQEVWLLPEGWSRTSMSDRVRACGGRPRPTIDLRKVSDRQPSAAVRSRSQCRRPMLKGADDSASSGLHDLPTVGRCGSILGERLRHVLS
jgi:hypothetical protein